MTAPVVVEGLSFRYRSAARDRTDEGWALRDVSFEIPRGSSVGIVGESGSGKSTLIRVLCGLLRPYHGSAKLEGREITQWLHEDPRGLRRRCQMIFQSPRSSFDPRMRVGSALAEPKKAIARQAPSQSELSSWLSDVGLGSHLLSRLPHQLSGGQLQRVSIARALSVTPSIIYADEPTSSLDVSVQAQVLNLMIELRERSRLTLVLVSHDLAVVSRVCDSIVVMKDGSVVDYGLTRDIFRSPSSPYTATLLDAARAVSITPTASVQQLTTTETL